MQSILEKWNKIIWLVLLQFWEQFQTFTKPFPLIHYIFPLALNKNLHYMVLFVITLGNSSSDPLTLKSCQDSINIISPKYWTTYINYLSRGVLPLNGAMPVLHEYKAYKESHTLSICLTWWTRVGTKVKVNESIQIKIKTLNTHVGQRSNVSQLTNETVDAENKPQHRLNFS